MSIELSALEVSLVNTMSREKTVCAATSTVKDSYDYALIDCMPSLWHDDHQRPGRGEQWDHPYPIVLSPG